MFAEGPSVFSRFIVCLVLSFLLIVIDQRQQRLESVRATLAVVLYPIHLVVDFPTTLVRATAEKFSSRRELRAANERLRAENLELRFRMQRYQTLERENERLRALLDTSVMVGQKVLAGELLAVETTPSAHEIIINQGVRSGVFPGQPILDAEGIMGQTVHVNPFSSTAMLITDPRHALSVAVNRSGVRAIAVGTGSMAQLDLNFIPNNADIAEGDLVVSSGMDGVFPAGYPVGVIEVIEFEPTAPFARIKLRPHADLAHAREVLFVWPQTPEQDTPAAVPATEAPAP
ncbi:MAG: rod shape-determining protein MreC [Gammaproteobacteria bacterium]|nr:rod shape-determining protein MreC [Gammaproteobacteria bacterium]